MYCETLEKLQKLLRLACKAGGGFSNERQTALKKAIDHANKHNIKLTQVIYELQIDISDLSHSLDLIKDVARRASRDANSQKSTKRKSYKRSDISGNYPVTGFQYYEGPKLKSKLNVGDALSLFALTTNPYDPYAVAVYWKTYMIGYLPKGKNLLVWNALQDDQPVRATIASMASHNSYGAIRIDIAL